MKNNFIYNPSRNSQPYTELNYAQNTSLHFDHFREIFLEVIYEYQPHELYTSNMPTSKLQLDSYGYANIKTEDIGSTWGDYQDGEAYSTQVTQGPNNSVITGWDKVWVDQSWKVTLEVPKREGQLDGVKIAGLIAKFLRTTGLKCIDAYRFARLFEISINARDYLNEFINIDAASLPSNGGKAVIVPGMKHKTGGDTNGHTGNVVRSIKTWNEADGGDILAMFDGLKTNFANIRMSELNPYMYMDSSAVQKLKNFQQGSYGNLQRFLENIPQDGNIRRQVYQIENVEIIPIPHGLMKTFFAKIDNPYKITNLTGATSAILKGGVSAADSFRLFDAGSIKDGYVSKFNLAVVDYFKAAAQQSVKDYGTIMTDIYGIPAGTEIKSSETIAMLFVGRVDCASIIQQYKEVKAIPYTNLPNTLNNFVELYWSHSVFCPVKMTGGIAAGLMALPTSSNTKKIK